MNIGEYSKLLITQLRIIIKYYNNELQPVLESGKFEVMIGPNSEDLQSCSFILE